MSGVEGVPEDVWAAAERVFTPPDYLHVPAIARAILAERERAAKVAIETGDSLNKASSPNAGGLGRVIARAIRAGATP